MIEVWKTAKAMAERVICHRVIYGGVALAYGAGMAGICDKAVTEAVLVAAYAVMALRG